MLLDVAYYCLLLQPFPHDTCHNVLLFSDIVIMTEVLCACSLRIQSIAYELIIWHAPLLQAQDRSNGNKAGHTQRASALAALSSAFNSSSPSKTSAPKPSSTSQGSQRAAAVAALSSVLTAEKKKQSPDASPTKSTSSTPAITSPPRKNTCTLDISFKKKKKEPLH